MRIFVRLPRHSLSTICVQKPCDLGRQIKVDYLGIKIKFTHLIFVWLLNEYEYKNDGECRDSSWNGRQLHIWVEDTTNKIKKKTYNRIGEKKTRNEMFEWWFIRWTVVVCRRHRRILYKRERVQMSAFSHKEWRVCASLSNELNDCILFSWIQRMYNGRHMLYI